MAITASVQLESGKTVDAGSDSTHPFQFRFSKEGKDHAKPTRIRSGWPGQFLAKRIWSGSKLVCRNHRASFLAGRTEAARYQFLTFRHGSVLP